MTEPPETPLTCYISSPLLVDTSPLRKLLAELGVTPIGVEELPTAGQAIASTLESWMRHTSFVCAILPAAQSANVLFEIGLALGLGHRTFIVAEDGADIPLPIERVPHLIAALDDTDTIRFHLEAFIASLPTPTKAMTATAASVVRNPGKFYGGGEAVSIGRDGLPLLNRGREIEHEVAKLLGNVSTQVTRSVQVSGFEADMLIWLRELDIGQGSPVLVELKLSASEAFPDRGLRQVMRALTEARLRAAILVTSAPGLEITARLLAGMTVFSVSLEGLRHEITMGTFLDNLRRLRNRIFHGAA